MSYSTPKDIKKMIELALFEEKYHISIAVYDGGEMICDCFRQGIETEDVVKLLMET